MKIVIAGGKAKADYLIHLLNGKGHQLIVINDDLEFCTYLSQAHQIPVVHGDPCKLYVLDEANIEDGDVIIALKAADADNLAICQTAKRLYRVKKTVAVVGNPKSVDIFKKLGINTAISATYMVAGFIEQMSVVENLVNCLPLDQGNLVINELMIGKNSPVAGKKLYEIELGDGVIICCIVRSSQIIVPKGQTAIQVNDKILVLSTPETQNEAILQIMGREPL